MIEALGVLATMFVLLSFLCTDNRKIRMVNIIGATLFVVYGLLSGALSVWLLNSALVAIHIYYLLKK
jgi:hypothetical protein